ncbi:MAG: hypothetical protein K6G08_08010 [Prevotella sp.]|nr:hypothetical protein [Prevotella sp.]
MAQNKYQIIEFKPTTNQAGMSHSFYAQAVVDNVITNKELAKKIEARGISRAAEIKAVLEEAANIIIEEVRENNRVQLEADGGVLVSIFPTATGSISDKDVVANPTKYQGKTVAEESMLTADMVKWSLGARIGSNLAKQFAQQKSAQKVAYSATSTPADPESGTDDQQGGGTDGGGSTDPNE